MSSIEHHIPDAMLAAYVAGGLPQAFSVVVAAHVSLCLECRCALEAHRSVGGAVLECANQVELSSGLKAQILEQLDEPFMPEPVYERSGIYPSPIVQALGGRDIKWRKLGMGVRQDILSSEPHGSVRLLYIPPRQAVPDHGHGGLEMTLVLQGSFRDEIGRFGVGDVEIADETLDHTPVAEDGQPCICLAATDAPLRFNALVPRLLQPLFRI